MNLPHDAQNVTRIIGRSRASPGREHLLRMACKGVFGARGSGTRRRALHFWGLESPSGDPSRALCGPDRRGRGGSRRALDRRRVSSLSARGPQPAHRDASNGPEGTQHRSRTRYPAGPKRGALLLPWCYGENRHAESWPQPHIDSSGELTARRRRRGMPKRRHIRVVRAGGVQHFWSFRHMMVLLRAIIPTFSLKAAAAVALAALTTVVVTATQVTSAAQAHHGPICGSVDVGFTIKDGGWIKGSGSSRTGCVVDIRLKWQRSRRPDPTLHHITSWDGAPRSVLFNCSGKGWRTYYTTVSHRHNVHSLGTGFKVSNRILVHC